jgi:hypothetical protein
MFPKELFDGMKTPPVLFFYKGTTFPHVNDLPNWGEKMMEAANEMIVKGLSDGVNLMEQSICEAGQGRDMTDQIFEKANELMGNPFQNLDDFHYTWCLNICALLKMKVIENDNKNGIFVMSTKRCCDNC